MTYIRSIRVVYPTKSRIVIKPVKISTGFIFQSSIQKYNSKIFTKAIHIHSGITQKAFDYFIKHIDKDGELKIWMKKSF